MNAPSLRPRLAVRVRGAPLAGMAARETDPGPEGRPAVRDLLGQSAEAACERFGRPVVDRWTGGDRWLRFEGPDWSLRARARPRGSGGAARIRSWTVAFSKGFDTLGAALRALGLGDAAPGPETGELRLPLRDGAGRLHSLTASRRGARIHSVSAFDEPPDWEDPTAG